MNLNKLNSNEIFLLVLAVISFLLIFRKINRETSILILITILVGYAVTKDGILSIAIGLILGNIYVSLNTVSKTNEVEGFKSTNKKSVKIKLTKKEKKDEKKLKKEDRVPKELIDEDEEEEEELDIEDELDDENTEEFQLDTKGSFYENYKSLTPKQVKGLNKDTKALINTQKQLIETLNNMGPALKDGRQILDSFKNYFGNEADLGKALKNYKTN